MKQQNVVGDTTWPPELSSAEESKKNAKGKSLWCFDVCDKVGQNNLIQYSLRQVKSNLDTLGKKVIYEIVQINPS